MLKNWIYAVVSASILCAVCLSLAPEGRTKKALEFVCGLIMIAAILSPLGTFNIEEYSLSAAKYRQEAEKLIQSAGETKEMLDRKYIESEYTAYILDKAKKNGVIPDDVIVTTEWNTDGYWYPVSVEIILSPTEYSKDNSAIKSLIETELGIPAAKQNWRSR